MPGIFDTHCHLMSEEYKDDDLFEIIKNAKMSNISKICNVGYDLITSREAIEQSYEYNNLIYAAIGIHPNDVAKHSDEDLIEIEELSHSPKTIAIGEIGLDYYHKVVSKQIQKEWFIKQLMIAKKNNLPVLIHCREAYEDCYEILRSYGINKGIMHCYLGSLDMAKKFIDLGFLISIGGVVTFKNDKVLKEIIANIPLKHMVVETDAPYLTPTPYRGKKNYPQYINYTIKKIAELKKTNVDEIIRITSRNANKLFKI